MFPRGSAVLAAVSGGKDSMALLHWLHSHGAEWGITLAVGHYHHGLRAEADADLELVEGWCRERKISFFARRGDVAGAAAQTGTGIEETGRRLRYEFLEETAERLGGAVIVTAHHADDNAETLLLHLTRGSGLQGLTGIPPRRGNVVRPLLTTTRAEIEAYVEAHEIPWAEDATNADTEFVRNRLRHRVTPVLRSINPGYVDSVSQTVSLLRADQEYLRNQAAALLEQVAEKDGELWIPCSLLREQPKALTSRLVILCLERLTGKTGFSAGHICAVLELAKANDPSGEISLPYGAVARRVYGDLVLAIASGEKGFSPTALREGENSVGEWRIILSAGENKLIVRQRQTGDIIRLPKQREKTLKKLLIEKKISRRMRDALPVVADEQGVLAVAGLGENTDHPLYGKVQIAFIPNKKEE